MKITAEFNSNEELLSFINDFGTKSFIPSQGVTNITNVAPLVEAKKTVKVEGTKNGDKPVEKTKHEDIKEVIKETIPTKEAEISKDEAPKEETRVGEPKITKEMIRERLGAIMKSGKQKEVKDLVAKHGAGKLPDLEEKEYAAVYEEAEGLI